VGSLLIDGGANVDHSVVAELAELRWGDRTVMRCGSNGADSLGTEVFLELDVADPRGLDWGD
jgi:hypothetical protein